jgi:hypothetical protein
MVRPSATQSSQYLAGVRYANVGARMPPQVDDLATMSVLDAAGAPVVLGSLWAERPAVLVFVRHFGCIHCRQHAVELNRNIDLIRGAGADLVIIGNGTPSFIAGFRDETGWDGPVYTDPTLGAYRAAELKRGVMKTLDPRGWRDAVGAFARGVRQGRTQGDQWQQGGVLAVGPGNRVLYHHASERAGDNASAETIAAALKRRAA